MTTVVRKFPQMEVDLFTENTSYELRYDTGKQLTQEDFEEALVSFSVKNDMSDDSPVFTLVILAKEKWDKMLNANDLIRIRAIPDAAKDRPDNPYIMVGLISDVHKEGEYANGTLMYRITGQAMTKALISFDVGVIQAVSTIVPDLGWLPDGGANGLNFSGRTAADIGNQLMERFVYKYAQYNFSGGKGLSDYFAHAFTSWDDEQLADTSSFVNYQGSMRQFLEDVSAKPFNELFFEYTSDGMCIALMRPTPFDPDAWIQLPTYKFTSDTVVEESFGKSDADVYSIFVVQAANLGDFSAMDLGVYPQFHPDLVKKYGYKEFDADNKYLLSNAIAASTASKSSVESTEIEDTVNYPTYSDVMSFITKNNYAEAETLRTQKNMIKADLVSQFPAMTDTLADNIIDALKDGDFTSDAYQSMVDAAGKVTLKTNVNKEKDVSTTKLQVYTQRLFNWYCENGNFYSGDIRVLGNPIYRVGSRILYEDAEANTTWEFYLESVQHEFSFTEGYTTILGVTRGLPDNGDKRFTNLWGRSQNFKGGYLGEPSLEDLMKQAQQADSTSDSVQDDSVGSSWGGNNGGTIATAALATAESMDKKDSVYKMGAGRTGKNPFDSSPIATDCSSFVWWCYYVNGVSLRGGKTGMTTDTIASDPQLTEVSSRGSSKSAAKKKLQKGDLVFFDTYKGDGHIGIYTGDGQFISSQDKYGIKISSMSSGYWWDHFNGHVMRYDG